MCPLGMTVSTLRQEGGPALAVACHRCAVKAAWRNVARPWGIQGPLEPLGLSLMGHPMR